AEDPLGGIDRAGPLLHTVRRASLVLARGRGGRCLVTLADQRRPGRDRGAGAGNADRLGHLGLLPPQLLLVVARAKPSGARRIRAALDAAGLRLSPGTTAT